MPTTKNQRDDPNSTKFEYKYRSDYVSDWDIHKNYINDFDAYEAMLIGKVYDSVSGSVDGSKITDSYAMTLAKERADRVMAKTPDGETESAAKADVGKAAFMDILRQKWIYPNANAQRPFQEKLNLWQLYSSVYGYMPMFYDWTTSNTGYVGPDCWLWNPRNLIPQQGRISIEDMDYITALTWVSKKKLEDIINDDDEKTEMGGWDKEAIRDLIDRSSSKSAGNDTQKDTLIERDRNPSGSKKGICLATRYEAGEGGKWITFAPDDGFVKVRELDNPHKNGRIPFVIKYSQPLFDSFYGLGDFQRAKPLQFARDGLTNFYFANLKRNLAPGIIVNANGVVKHTLDVTKANPVLMETIPNSIRPMPTNTAGLSTYQGAQSNLTGSLLSLYGTQNASIPGAESLNPSQGKTPAAVEMYSTKEATRDGAERRHLETAIEQLTDGFFSLVVNIGTEDIPVSLFSKDIEAIAKAGLTDVLGIFKGNLKPDSTLTAGELIIDPKKLKGVDYRFSIDTNSTMQINKEKQLQNLERFVDNMGKFQNIFKDDPRVEIHPDKIGAAFGELSDIPNADEFVTSKPGPTPQEAQMQQKMAELQAQSQQQQQTQLQTDTGQVHESADLVKLLALYPTDQVLKEQVLGIMGLKSGPPSQEPIMNGAGMFHDPEVAQAAEHIVGMSGNPQEPAQSTATATGSYNDPHIAEIAGEIDKLGAPKTPVGGENDQPDA